MFRDLPPGCSNKSVMKMCAQHKVAPTAISDIKNIRGTKCCVVQVANISDAETLCAKLNRSEQRFGYASTKSMIRVNLHPKTNYKR